MKGNPGHLFLLLVRVDEEFPCRGAFHSFFFLQQGLLLLLLEIIACAKSI